MVPIVGSFYEFFAGGGMARAGLGDRWRCLFANDFDRKKAATYTLNWGADNLLCGDVRDVTTRDLIGVADLAWASFPCQDLSLAGSGAGLKGERSGTFWPFWNLMTELADESRAPAVIVVENVCGTLSSHGGKDFKAICEAFRGGDYRFGALVLDAVHFVPQSRPRLLIIAVRGDVPIPDTLCGQEPAREFHSRSLRNSFGKLPADLKERWIWWCLPAPPSRNAGFSDLIEEDPGDILWHTPAETRKLLDMMSDVNLGVCAAEAQAAGQDGSGVCGDVADWGHDGLGRGVADESGWLGGRREGRAGVPRSFHRRDGVGHGALRRPGGCAAA